MSVQKVYLLNQKDPVIVTGGLVPKGAYVAETDYAVGDSVDYLGSSYVMFVDAAAGTLPTDTTKWQVLANGGVGSVNTKTGVVVLDPDDLDDAATTHKFVTAGDLTNLGNLSNTNSGDDAVNSNYSGLTQYTDELAQDAVGGMVDSTLTYTDGTPELKVTNPVTPAATGFSITAGTTPKTLTVTDTSAINQDLKTTASPTFAGLTASGGLGTFGTTAVSGDIRSMSGDGTSNYLSIKSEGEGTNKSGLFRAGKNYFVYYDTSNGDTVVDAVHSGGAIKFNINQANKILIDTSGNLAPATDSIYTLGTSSLYWSNTYTDTLNLNSTASISGGTAGALGITGLVGIGTTAPTHTLTLSSTSTGIALYNTADQTTNYERMLARWSSDVFRIETNANGTGTARDLVVGSASTNLLTRYAQSSSGSYDLSRALSSANVVHTRLAGTMTQSSGIVTGLSISPTINQSSTAGYTALLINPTETATGSGAKNLIDARIATVSKFKVDNAGNTTWVDAANFAVGTTTGTKIGTDTTQKLAFWNATPVVQPAHIADPTGGVVVDAEARTAIASINALLSTIGLSAAS